MSATDYAEKEQSNMRQLIFEAMHQSDDLVVKFAYQPMERWAITRRINSHRHARQPQAGRRPAKQERSCTYIQP